MPPRRPAARIVERRTKAVTLRVKGLSHREIAAALSVSPGTVQTDLDASFAEWRAERLGDLDMYQTIILMRYEEAFRQWWPWAQEGDAEALGHVLSILRSVTDMLGLKKPAQVEFGGFAGGPIRISAEPPLPDLSLHSTEQLRDLLRQADNDPA